MNEGLAHAIRTESAIASMAWFGVGVKAVWRWRAAFSVGRATIPGSQQAIQAVALLGAQAIQAKDWADEELDCMANAAKIKRDSPDSVFGGCHTPVPGSRRTLNFWAPIVTRS